MSDFLLIINKTFNVIMGTTRDKEADCWPEDKGNEVARKNNEYNSFKARISTMSVSEVFSEISRLITLDINYYGDVRGPLEVYHTRKGSQVEINELLFSLLHNKFSNLVLCFYQLETASGIINYSTLASNNGDNKHWSVIEQTNPYLIGRLDRLKGTLERTIDETTKILQNHFCGKCTYSGTGIVSLSGGVVDSATYFEKVKRFYVRR